MFINNKSVKIIILTYNAGPRFADVIIALNSQQGLEAADVLVIDSSSRDGTVMRVKAAGYNIKVIPHAEFGHGATRAWAVEHTDADIIVFLTQDAILAQPDAIATLVKCFKDEQVAAAFGRQIPYQDAGLLTSFARIYNYPAGSRINTLANRETKGIKSAFLSDSFAAYRKSALMEIGNFEVDLDFGEDTIAAAKLLMSGYKTAYCAEAVVYHSHDFSHMQKFQRYRTTGRFHKEHSLLIDEFGKAESEGIKFVQAEMRYLQEQGKSYLRPWALVRDVAKYVGYLWGKHM